MLANIWRLLWPYAQDLDGGWLRNHPHAEIVKEEKLPKGWKKTVRCGNEQRTYLQDEIGNVIAVLP